MTIHYLIVNLTKLQKLTETENRNVLLGAFIISTTYTQLALGNRNKDTRNYLF